MLIRAILQDNFKMTKKLIDAGLNVNYRTADERTPLGSAAKVGSRSIVDLLLVHRADVELPQGRSAPFAGRLRKVMPGSLKCSWRTG